MLRMKLFYGSMFAATVFGATVAFSQVSVQVAQERGPSVPTLSPPAGDVPVQTGPRPELYGPGYPNPRPYFRTPGSPAGPPHEMELNAKVQDGLDKYTAAKDDDGRQAARKQIQGALTELFDARQKEREEEIKEIEERVAKLRETLKKRESMRQELIEHHLTTLIQDLEGLGWGPEGGANGPGPVFRATTTPEGNAFYRIQRFGGSGGSSSAAGHTVPVPGAIPRLPENRRN